jgi:hypothetical protein
MSWIIYLAVVVAVFAGMWKAFEKAGAPGWAAIVPIFNVWVMTKMADKPGWWVVLIFIPLVNIIILIIISMAIAPKYGKSEGFGIGMALLGFIFWPILGFGDAEWNAAPVTI